MNRKLILAYFCTVSLIVLIGCTATEWGRIKDDAVRSFPELMDDIGESGGNPISLVYILGAYVGGLVSKSAARGFGKGSKKTVAVVSSAVKGLLKPKEIPDAPPEDAEPPKTE